MENTKIISVNTHITPADIDAALAFIKKRARKRRDPIEGVSVALFAAMFATCEGLVECGLPLSAVDAILSQYRSQILAKLEERMPRQ